MATRWPKRMRALGALGLAALLAAGLVLAPAAATRAEPNYYEQRQTEAQALEAFNRVIELWEEEAYFELYSHGTTASRARISRDAFAQRMVQLSWKPSGPLNPTYTKAEFRFRTVVYVTARIPYKGKFNPDDQFSKKQTLLMQEENGQWKVDLIALIRAPYAGA